jgi:hypothetical protein
LPTANQLQKLKTKARRGRFATHPRHRYAFGDDRCRLQTNFKNSKQKQKLGAGASRLIRAVGMPSATIVVECEATAIVASCNSRPALRSAPLAAVRCDCDDAAIEERSLVAAGKASRGSVGMTT